MYHYEKQIFHTPTLLLLLIFLIKILRVEIMNVMVPPEFHLETTTQTAKTPYTLHPAHKLSTITTKFQLIKRVHLTHHLSCHTKHYMTPNSKSMNKIVLVLCLVEIPRAAPKK